MSDRSEIPACAVPALPDVPHVPADLLAFEAGEATGELSGLRAERADVLAYLIRKQANALRVAKRGHDEHDYAHHTARAISILIDDLRTGMHEGEAMVQPEGVAIVEPYPFRDHRTVAEADADAGARATGAMTQMGER